MSVERMAEIEEEENRARPELDEDEIAIMKVHVSSKHSFRRSL